MKNNIFVALFILVLSSAQAGGYAIRTIASGESIGYISNIYNISSDAIMRKSQLNDELLHPGDIIKIPLVEATGGIAEFAPVPPPSFRTHSIHSGESLSTIASNYSVSVEAIVGANQDISSLDLLPVGLELLIPPRSGTVHTLNEGLELVDLVKKHNLNVGEVLELNAIETPSAIRAGMMVFLPDLKPVAALERLAKVREEENRYVWPVHGRITSYFGRRNLGMGTSSFHSAIDVAAPTGTAVIAARSGTVTYSGWSPRGYGNLIKISHAGGSESWYAHHSKLLVSVGEYVNQGDVIGRVGSTGLSTGPHLHFEIHENGRPIDPLSYL